MDQTQKQAILDKITELRDLRIFSKMEDRMIFEIMKRCNTVQYSAGEIVFSEGDTDDYSLYIVVKGDFEIVANAKTEGESMTFSCAGQGLIFGEISFLDAQPRSATLKAMEAAEVLRFTQFDYLNTLTQSPEVAARFMIGIAEVLSRRLRGANRRLKFVS